MTTIIALGGWQEGSQTFSDMAKDPVKRNKFVKSAVAFLKEHDFDGLDVDWEFPSKRGGDKRVDKASFIALLTQLKEAFEPQGFLLSSAVSPVKKTIDSAYDLKKLNELVDIINVMTYDYHGGWEDKLGLNAPLNKRPDEVDQLSLSSNVNFTVNYYIEKGVDKKKMVMGMPFYGRAWTLQSADKVNLNDKAKGPSPAGSITGEEGVLGYNEVSKIIQNNSKFVKKKFKYLQICELQKSQSSEWTVKYDSYYKTPYAYNKSIWVGYDNLKSISCKVSLFNLTVFVFQVFIHFIQSKSLIYKLNN